MKAIVLLLGFVSFVNVCGMAGITPVIAGFHRTADPAGSLNDPLAAIDAFLKNDHPVSAQISTEKYTAPNDVLPAGIPRGATAEHADLTTSSLMPWAVPDLKLSKYIPGKDSPPGVPVLLILAYLVVLSLSNIPGAAGSFALQGTRPAHAGRVFSLYEL